MTKSKNNNNSNPDNHNSRNKKIYFVTKKINRTSRRRKIRKNNKPSDINNTSSNNSANINTISNNDQIFDFGIFTRISRIRNINLRRTCIMMVFDPTWANFYSYFIDFCLRKQEKEIEELTKKIKEDKTVINNIFDLPENKKTCRICLDDFKNGDKINILNCGHVFHFSCLDEEIKHRQNCPLCKVSLISKS